MRDSDSKPVLPTKEDVADLL